MNITFKFPGQPSVERSGDPPKPGELVVIHEKGKETHRGRVVPGGVVRIYGSEAEKAIVLLEDAPPETEEK